MKGCFMKIRYWTVVLGIALTVNEIFGQEEVSLQDIANLCNDKRTPDCEWLETYRQQSNLNDLQQKLNDGDTDTVTYHSRNHIFPRSALYDHNRDIIQYPFTFWKNQANEMSWNSVNKMGKLQARKPFNYDKKRAMNSFSSWGGKRDNNDQEDQINNKREPGFSSWGGKRTQKFFNWGGKRSIPENDASNVNNYDHNIMKRSANSEFKTEKREKRLCITDEMNLQELFKEFIDWSRKQPEQKKGAVHRKMFSVSTLHSPDNLSRRAGSFFSWGGKRNAKQD